MNRRHQQLAWLIAGLVAIRLLTMWLLPMSDTTEPRYADIARMMAQSGDWITPWFKQGVPFWGKPPLSFWAGAASMKLLGVSAFAARFPSWIAHLISLLLLMSVARSMGGRRQALWTGLLFASMALPFAMAGAVLTDPFLNLGTTLTLVAFLRVFFSEAPPGRHWGYLFFVGLAVGLLAKGPVTIVLCGGPIFLWCLWTNRWRDLWQRLPWISGTLLMLLIALPWYILAELKTPGFLDYFIVGEHIKRFLDPGWAGDRYGTAHQRPHGTIWLYWLLATLPWGLVGLGAMLRQVWKGRKAVAADAGSGFFRDHSHRLLLLWSLFPALFFTLAGNVLWTYLLPATPAVALLVVRWLARADRPLPARRARALMVGAAVLPLLATAGGVYISGHPEKLKTDIGLVKAYRQHAHPGQDAMLYLPERSFSGRFYSGGTARTTTLAQLEKRLRARPGQTLVAIEHSYLKKARATLNAHFQLIEKGHDYSLYALSAKDGGQSQF